MSDITEDEIARVARAICANLGLDPDERVGHGYGDTWTPAEWGAYKSDSIPMVMLYSERWRLYRGKAAEALATAAAIRKG